MDTVLVVFLGLLLGGVVNALADDLPVGRRLSRPKYPDGSRRPLLAWLGITAFALGLRRAAPAETEASRRLDSKTQMLTWRYPLVELVLAALITLTFAIARDNRSLPGDQMLIWQTLVVIFVLIAVVDLEHRRVLFAPLLATVAVAIVGATVFRQSPPSVASMIVGALCAGLVFSLIYQGGLLFGRLAARFWGQPLEVTVFGRGDVYLMTAGGLLVGFPHVLVAMVLTVFAAGIGALLSVALHALFHRRYRPFAVMPYGPYILASTYAVLILHDQISRAF